MFEIICDPCNMKEGIFISKSILSSLNVSYLNCSSEALARGCFFFCNYNGIWRSMGSQLNV